jgi:hypothetical protein
MFCVESAQRRITDPIIFMDTLNSEREINLILNRFFPELKRKRDCMVREGLDCMVSEALWPAHSLPRAHAVA